MAELTGVSINRLEGGLGRRSDSTDNVMALVSCMPLTTLNLEENEALKLLQLSDAEAVGVDPAYDANKDLLIHHHISEFFRLAPGATLYLIGVEPASEGDSNVKDYIDAILPTIRENKDIKGIGFVGFEDTYVSLAGDVEDVQGDLVGVLQDENRFIDFVLLEGVGTGTLNPGSAADLRSKNAPNVSVVIGQDMDVAEIDEAYENYAAVGSALGMLAVRKVNENIGSVNVQNKPRRSRGWADYPLTYGKKWLKPGFSTNESLAEFTKADLDQLNDKGYIYAAAYEGYSGVFFQNSPTCVTKSSDFAYIENNRVWNKAARLIRMALIPVVKSTVKKDPTTGYIRSTTISYWEGLANKKLEEMMIDDEISGFDFYIDPKQIVNSEESVKGTAQIVMDGIVHEFEIDLGLINSID